MLVPRYHQNHLRLLSQLYSPSLLVITSRLGACRVNPPPSATCSNSPNNPNTYNSRQPASAATMSTVAIPVSQHPHQPHHPHPHSSPRQQDQEYNLPSDGFDSETPSSSRASSRSRTSAKKSRNSPDQKQQSGSQQRMSAFFPLGYKEAAYQWVCPFLFYAPLELFSIDFLC